ncbi:DUF1761 family protein [Microbacterium sp.]|uniref:DUF1761 family protein n=1 Tax=Microbacterium sp. TaxID=51671 RepID=UPI00281100FF|nr:DUF1761 family protein [Microbacterium sp.]
MIVLGIAIATVTSFIASAALYAVPQVSGLVTRNSTPRPGLSPAVQIGSVALRSLIASCLVAGLMAAADWHGAATGALLGLALSALPLILLMGGVVHENTALPTAGVHLLDWVLKLTIIGTVIGLFI